MQQIVRPLAAASAVAALALIALPADASASAMHAAAAVTAGHGTPAPGTTLTSPQRRALARAERLRALLGQRGAISGIVRSPGGAPARNVCVRAVGPLATRVGFSRPDGRFVITGLPVGAYRVEYRGCSRASRFIGQWYGGVSAASAAKVVVASAKPAELAPVTLRGLMARPGQAAVRSLSPTARALALIRRLEAGLPAPRAAAGAQATPARQVALPARSTAARIYGRVTSRAGHPLRGVTILAVPASSGFGGVLLAGYFARTSSTGRYSLAVPPGRYHIDFLPVLVPGNYAPQLWKGAGSVARSTVLRVRARAVIRKIDAVLGAGAAIEGRARSGPNAHASFAGLCVLAEGLSGQRLFLGFTITRADGTFRLPGLATGRYRLSFFPGCGPNPAYLPASLPRPVAVTDGKTTTGISVYLRLGGTITGIVKDSDGNPLPNICVGALPLQGGIPFPSGPAATDAHGIYRVQGLVSGDYAIQAAPGCGNSGPYAPAAVPAPVHVRTGRTTTGANVTMPIEGTLTGVVKNASGRPLAGACVVAISPDPLAPFTFGSTTASGTYRLRNLPPGRTVMAFFPGCGLAGNYLESDTLTTVLSKATVVLDAVLATGGVITGVVRDSRGHPLAGICVFVVDPANPSFGEQAVTDPSGGYRLSQLNSTSYYVVFTGGCGNSESVAPQAYHADPTFFAPGPVPVTAGQTTPGIDASLAPGGTVTGQVTDRAGRPLSGVCVVIASATGAGTGGFEDVQVSRHGSFRSANLPPGQFGVLFGGTLTSDGCGPSKYADQQFRALGSAATPDLLSVRGGVVTAGADAALRLAGQISGVATDKAGPPFGICVQASDARTHAAGFTITGPQGHYTIPDLPAGRYTVEFSDCVDGIFASQWYPHRPTPSSAARVIVRAGHVTRNIDARLWTGGVITGQVRYTPGNRPIDGVCVLAANLALNIVNFASTDRNGRYTVTGLSTGGYQLVYSPCQNGTALSGQVSIGQVQVTAGRTVSGADELLGAGGSVSGVVKAGTAAVPTGAPGTCVLALPLGPGALGSVGWAGSAGRYSVTNLAPGQYVVLFGDPSCSDNSPSLAARLYGAGPVQVTALQDTSGINATLRAAGGIAGVVRGPHGALLSGICAQAIPVLGGASTVVGVTAAGRYRIVGLQSGPYKVMFTTGCGAAGYGTRWYRNAPGWRQAATVHVSAGTLTAGISVTLTRA